MTLHGFFLSSAAHRLRIALNLKGIAYDTAPVHLRRGDQRGAAYLALNPQGLVPALEADGAVFTQSLATIEWLDETRPEPPLLPADPAERAHVRAFAQVIACDIHPLQNLRVLRYLKKSFGQEQPALDAWARHWNAEGLATCEALLAGRPETAFAFGERPGLAEVCLVPQMGAAERFGLDLGPYPRLARIRAACEALPAFAAAAPARQPDAPPPG
ncbi:MAG: maleylacetoacetate isomerase [Amaricoccus sp.]|uniref:maleylacetoacetate isomerase n=1 Tax=Amaricoccus sp. TaxID=1872485 RepID=UPI0039E517D0